MQAGLRATGELSLVDWPRFADCEPPDFEVFSKALNGGQFRSPSSPSPNARETCTRR